MTERCFDFTQDRCTRGENCRFSHGDDHGGKGPTKGAQTCFDYSIGKCTRGDDCRFEHASVHVPSGRGGPPRRDPPRYDDPRGGGDRYDDRRGGGRAVGRASDRYDDRRGGGGRDDRRNDDRRGPAHGGVDRCFDFTVGRCTRGADCRFAHPETCFDFSVGKCDRDDCRFFHSEVHVPSARNERRDSHRDAPPTRYDSFNDRRGPIRRDEPRDRFDNRDRRDDRGGRRDDRRGGGGGERCFDFTQGKCSRGSACRFVHEETCYDFSIGKCDRDNCRFLHVPMHQGPEAERGERAREVNRCYDFSVGKCTRGDSCKFAHEEGDMSPRNSRAAPY